MIFADFTDNGPASHRGCFLMARHELHTIISATITGQNVLNAGLLADRWQRQSVEEPVR